MPHVVPRVPGPRNRCALSAVNSPPLYPCIPPCVPHPQEAIEQRYDIDPSGLIMRLNHYSPWKEHLYNLEKELGVDKPILFCLVGAARRWAGWLRGGNPGCSFACLPLPVAAGLPMHAGEQRVYELTSAPARCEGPAHPRTPCSHHQHQPRS